MSVRPDALKAASNGISLASERLPCGVGRALEWLNGRLDEPVQLEALAAIAEVRPRTLEAQFRKYLGTTPLGWVRQARLARAHQQLLAADEKVSVTDVALANGFSQLGRFAAQYRHHFGELPSETLRAARRKGAWTEEISDEALRLSWRALSSAFMVGPKSCDAAIAYVQHAQGLAPNYSLPKAIAAWCWSQRAAHNFSSTPHQDRANGLRFAKEAVRLAPNDPLVISLCSGALTLTRCMTDADKLIERSLAMDPFSPWGWIRRGWLSAYLGDDESALRDLRNTLRLMPFEPLRHLVFIGIGCVHFNAGRYERALHWIEDGVAAEPDSFWASRVTIAAAVHAGARAEARRRAKNLLTKDPNLTVTVARQAWPFRASFMERLADGLVAAGIPRA